jgi:lysophospholipase L1-like esterase
VPAQLASAYRAVTLAAALALAAPLTLAATGPSPSSAGRSGVATSYYLALGDSLAQGVQPSAAGASVPTSHGYANQLYAALRLRHPGLRLVKLGCSGETTATMINGGICSYPQGSQLAAAVAFLRAHPGRVSLITIDIGANDPNSCLALSSLGKIASCMRAVLPRAVRNLTEILTGLRAAGGRGVAVIGMSYYVPELAAWRSSPSGEAVAALTERLVASYNAMLAAVYRKFGARLANVFGAFHSGDFTDRVRLPGDGSLPRNVATVCLWTWACSRGPRGPNEHPNATGYAVIALAFLLADPSLTGAKS